jgi:zinc ribbon protein/predicted membrane protein DUF2127
MFCKNCGNEAPDNYKFCPACGKSLDQIPTTESTAQKQPRPTGITILAILQLVIGIFFAIAAIGIEAISSMGGMSGMRGMSYFGEMTGAVVGFIAVILMIMAVVAFIISGALFSGKRWGRTIVIIFSIIDLIFEAVSIIGGNGFAIVGIILDLVILYYMWRPHVISYFQKV